MRLTRMRAVRWASDVVKTGKGMSTVNYCGMTYLFCLISSLISVNACYTCPTLYSWEACRPQILFGCVVLFYIGLNWYLFLIAAKYNKVPALASFASYPQQRSSLILDCSSDEPGSFPQDPLSCRDFGNSRRHSDSNINRGRVSSPAPATAGGYLQQLALLQANETELCDSIDPADANFIKFCATCDMRVPKRCHHCPVCGFCIVRKDHHCFLTGACVGIANQCHFIVFLFWGSIGATYGLVWTGRLMMAHFSPFWPYGWLSLIFPVALAQWYLWDTVPFIVAMSTLLFSMGLSGCIGAIGFLCAQMFCVFRGITLWEIGLKIPIHDGLSIAERTRCVLGKWWLLLFVFPLLPRTRILDPVLQLQVERLRRYDV